MARQRNVVLTSALRNGTVISSSLSSRVTTRDFEVELFLETPADAADPTLQIPMALESSEDGGTVWTSIVSSTHVCGSFGREKFVITSVGVGNPSTVICPNVHGLASGAVVSIEGSNAVPNVNGARTVTVTTIRRFTIPVNVTGAGTGGTWSLPRQPRIGYGGTTRRTLVRLVIQLPRQVLCRADIVEDDTGGGPR